MVDYDFYKQKCDLLILYSVAGCHDSKFGDSILSFIDAGEFGLALDGIIMPFEEGSASFTAETFDIFQRLVESTVNLDDPELKDIARLLANGPPSASR